MRKLYAGSIPAAGAEDDGRASQSVMASRSKRVERNCLEGSTPSPSAATKYVPLADRQRRQPSKLDRRVRFPHGTLYSNLFGDRLTVGYLTLNQVIEVRILFPELGEPEPRRSVRLIPDPG